MASVTSSSIGSTDSNQPPAVAKNAYILLFLCVLSYPPRMMGVVLFVCRRPTCTSATVRADAPLAVRKQRRAPLPVREKRNISIDTLTDVPMLVVSHQLEVAYRGPRWSALVAEGVVSSGRRLAG